MDLSGLYIREFWKSCDFCQDYIRDSPKFSAKSVWTTIRVVHLYSGVLFWIGFNFNHVMCHATLIYCPTQYWHEALNKYTNEMLSQYGCYDTKENMVKNLGWVKNLKLSGGGSVWGVVCEMMVLGNVGRWEVFAALHVFHISLCRLCRLHVDSTQTGRLPT